MNNVFTGIYTRYNYITIYILLLYCIKIIVEVIKIIIIIFLTPSLFKSPYLLRVCFLVKFGWLCVRQMATAARVCNWGMLGIFHSNPYYFENTV